MDNATMMLHTGGWDASEAEVNAVSVPERTETYTPIPHSRLIEQFRRTVPLHGMKIERLRLGLANEGKRLFGVANVVNGSGQPDWGIALGFRNSYDKSMTVDGCGGTNVFVCDNLAMHGQFRFKHRHVGTVDRDLPAMVEELVGQMVGFKAEMTAQVDRFKAAPVSDSRAHDVACLALRAGIVRVTSLPRVLDEWYKPSHVEFEQRTAWSLFNAFTEIAKGASPATQMSGTLGLTGLFNREFAAAN